MEQLLKLSRELLLLSLQSRHSRRPPGRVRVRSGPIPRPDRRERRRGCWKSDGGDERLESGCIRRRSVEKVRSAQSTGPDRLSPEQD